jgi:ferric-dicitrate binding protein FerR (iron transport regulator)
MSSRECLLLEKNIGELHGGGLPEHLAERLRRHAAKCPRCRESLALWSDFEARIRRAAPSPLSPMKERGIAVGAATLASHRPTRHPEGGRGRRPTMPLDVAAALLLTLAAVVLARLHAGGRGAVIPGPNSDPPAAAVAVPEPGREQPPGDLRVVTTADGRQLLSVDPVTSVWLSRECAVGIDQADPGMVRLHLMRGTLLADVGPHEPGFRFVVTTPDGEVETMGTVFAIEVDSAGRSETRVIRGMVEVRGRTGPAGGGGEAKLLVGEGQTGRVGAVTATSTNPVSAASDVLLLEGPLDGGERERLAAVSGADDPATSHKDRAMPKQTAGAPEHGAPPEAGREPASAPASLSGEAAVVERLLAAAVVQRKSGDYSSAAGTYGRTVVEHPDSLHAQSALISLGQLCLGELKDPATAAAHFETYLDRWPDGPLAEEARLGLVRARARCDDPRGLEEAASGYLERHPAGYAGAEVTRRRGDARRTRGDCAGAVRDYRQILAWWPASPEYAAAEEGLAACEGDR